MFYVLPKVGLFKEFPFCKIYDFSNLDVYTYMQRACLHDFYTSYARCNSHIGSSLNQNFMFKFYIRKCNFFYMSRANN